MQQKEGNQRVLLWIGTFMQKIFNLFEKPGGFFFFFPDTEPWKLLCI